MKYTESFEDFLEKEVNLNKTRIDKIKDGVAVVKKFIQNSEVFKDNFINIVPQGSYRQKTIIKPLSDSHTFDVDLLLELREFSGWSPKQYLDNLHKEFKENGIYEDIVDRHGKNRCVTLDYADDFHIDIIPTIKNTIGCHIMNKDTDLFESTDGDGYAEWFERMNTISTGDLLIKVVRLAKYIRDKESIPIKSIMLTTLLGNLVLNSDNEIDYFDLPTAFKVLFGRLDDYFQSHSVPPDVRNPILSTESFTRHWNQDNFEKTKDKLRIIRKKIDESYNSDNDNISKLLWKQIFGENFVVSDSNDIDNIVAPCDVSNNHPNRDSGEMFLSDLGITESIQYEVVIDANIVQDGFRPFRLRNSTKPLAKKRKIEFIIDKCTVPPPYLIKWKIKNSGFEALSRNDLRGEIVSDSGYRNKRENTKYEGSHYAECYLIKDEVCVAKDLIDVPIGSY
jgi:hypothetical protein